MIFQGFFKHVLERVDWTRDLHFQTRTTIDTLDYSGEGWNEGSKLVIAACGKPIRNLATQIPTDFKLNDPFSDAQLVMPGVIAVNGPAFTDYHSAAAEIKNFEEIIDQNELSQIALLILCDESQFVSKTLNNFLWTVFTRANPSHDIYGIKSGFSHKHWGCRGPLIIDARAKPHHAPELIPDPIIQEKVTAYFSKNGALHNKF